jgi:hypothetical protein
MKLYHVFTLLILFILTFVMLLLYTLRDVLPNSENFFFFLNALLEVVVPVLAGLLFLDTYNELAKTDLSRPFWLLAALALFSWGVIGGGYSLMYFFANPNTKLPYPSFADVGYLGFIPLLLAALITLRSYFGASAPWWGRLLALLAFVATSAAYFWWVWWESDLINNLSQSSPLELFTEALYTLLDPALLAVGVLTASILGFSPASRPLWLLLFGLSAYFIANLIYTYLEYHDLFEDFSSVNAWLYVAWFGGFTAMAVAAVWFQSLMRSE